MLRGSLTEILAKRNMKPKVCRVQREQAIKAAKEQKKATREAKKATTSAPAKEQQPKQKAPKNVQTAAPRVVDKRLKYL